MGRSVEKTGKNVNDAIASALAELKLSIDDVHVDVLEEGKSGLFGLLSGKPAKVRVSELEEDERIPQPEYPAARQNARTDTSAGAAKASDNGYGKKGVAQSGYVTDVNAIPDKAVATDAAAAAEAAAATTEAATAADAAAPETYGSDTSANVEYAAGLAEDDYPDEMQYDFENEVNRASDYLNVLFDGIHVSVSIYAEPTDDGFLLNIESDDSGILIGHRGETLDALQYLLNLYMNKKRDTFIRVTVDVENYKKKREAALIKIADQMADKVVRLHRNFTLDAMNSYERRIVHSALQNHPRVETYSVGEDPNRRVVVTLKNRGGYSSR